MLTPAPTCTEPGRWAHPPEVDAPDDEVLAYLRHCDGCAYHAHMQRAEEGRLDPLLRVASRTLVVGSLPTATAPPRERRQPPAATVLRSARRRPVRALATFGLLAAVAAGVLLGTGEQHAGQGSPLPMLTENQSPVGTPGEAVADVQAGSWYDAQVIRDTLDGRWTTSGLRYDRESLTAAVKRLPYGTRLRVVNPTTGASVEVIVIDRGPEEGEIHLSARAAAVLGVVGTVPVLVHALSEDAPFAIGP